MIKKLRRKFIAVSVLSVFVVLTVIMSAINILNYSRVVRDSDAVLNVLAENNGQFPKREGGYKHKERSRDWLFDEQIDVYTEFPGSLAATLVAHGIKGFDVDHLPIVLVMLL